MFLEKGVNRQFRWFISCAHYKFVLLGMEINMKATTKKIVGVTALSAMTLVELIQMQQANATPVTFTGSVQPDGHFGSNIQVAITVDTVAGKYQITGITTPVIPTGQNGSFANFAIPTLTTEALAAQSANIAGVSGASSISAGWIASLASAIAAAAAAGETIGTVPGSTTPSPTPTGTTPPPPPPTPKPTTSPVDPNAAVLAKLVAAGTITQAQANIILAALQAAHVTPPRIGDGDDASEGAHGSEGSEGAGKHSTPKPTPTATSTDSSHAGIGQTLRLSIAQDLSVITTTLGITAGQLQANLSAGQSLATIAGTKTPALITAIVTAETARINARVKPGGLTQAQATALIAGLMVAVTTEVNAVPAKGSRGFGLPTSYGALFAAPAKHK